MNKIKTLLALALLIGPLSAEKPSSYLTDHHHYSDKIQATLDEKSGSNSIDRQKNTSPDYDDELWPPSEEAGGEQQQLSSIETYERVVLEGSRISISCPHSTIIEPKRQLFARTTSNHGHRADGGEWQNQFASTTTKQQQQQQQNQTTTACQHELEQVKWFRNHVPLVNANHHHHHHHHHFREKQTPLDLVGEQQKLGQSDPFGDTKFASEAARPEEADPLNWTTELFQTTTTTIGGPISRSLEQWQQNNQQPKKKTLLLANQSETLDSLEYDNQHRQWGSLTSSENVNEPLGGERKLTNVPAASPHAQAHAPRWYLNKFGELVINRVSRYFAGKYTCLIAGRQSEVLLDVLPTAGDNSEAEESQHHEQQAYKVVVPETEGAKGEGGSARGGGASLPGGGLMGDEAAAAATTTAPSREFSGEWQTGNEPIEEEEREGAERPFDSRANTTPTTSTNSSSWLGHDGRLMGAAGQRDTRARAEAKNREGVNSRADNNSSPGANWIKTLGGDAAAAADTATGDQRDRQLGQDEENRLERSGSSEGVVTGLSAEVEASAKEEEITRRFRVRWWRALVQQQRRRPLIHVINSEAIQMSDLKLVPGFLYTKQQLYCPISGLSELHLDHIYPLIHELCPSSSHPDRARESVFDEALKGDEQSKTMMRCYRLAERLIRRVVVRGAHTNKRGHSLLVPNCSVSVFHIVWFNNGKHLEFDTNGRASNTNLNVKLINLPGPLSSVEASSGREDASSKYSQPDDTERDKKSIETRRSDNDKWICPPEGRTIEIDNIRKESAGRYSCALKLSLPNLEKIIQTLRPILSMVGPSPPTNQPKIKSAPHPANDISCCDKITAPTSQFNSVDHHKWVNKSGSQPNSSLTEVTGWKLREDHVAKRIALLDGILNGTITSDESLTQIGHLLSRVRLPLKTIQSFSLVVAERAANSCDLWSTILEAGYAYTRRKLADFRRLKRNSNGVGQSIRGAESSQTASSTKLKLLKNVDSPQGHKLSSSTLSSLLKHQQQQPGLTMPTTDAIGNSLPSSMGANQSEQLYANDKDESGLMRASKEEQVSMNSSDKWAHQGNHDNGVSNAISYPNGDHDKLVAGQREVEVPLYGWRSVSGPAIVEDDSAWRPIGGDATNNQDQQNKKTIAALNNSDRFESDIFTDTTGSENGLGQTNIHTVEAEPFNYANERASTELIYATATAATAATTTVASSVMEAAYDAAAEGEASTRRGSPMIKGNHEYSRVVGGTKDLITQRGRHHNNNNNHQPRYGTNRDGQITNFRSSATPPEPRDSSAFISKWHPMVIDGNQPQLKGHIIDSLHGVGDKINFLAAGHEITSKDLNTAVHHLFADDFDVDGAKKLVIQGVDGSAEATNEDSEIGAGRASLRPDHLLGDKLQLPTGVATNVDPPNTRFKRSSGNQMNSQLNELTTRSSSARNSDSPATGQVGGPHDDSLGDSQQPKSLDADQHQSSVGDSVSSIGLRPFVGVGQPAADSITKPMAYDDRYDESLMWTAGQYLYMHMRALAASSMFGVEVAVEWSNERSNGTNIDFTSDDVVDKNPSMESDMLVAKNQLDGGSGGGGGYSPNGRIRDAIPFATIDVISGQSLQLQCTAQALGRLPEVRWYKRVNTIPSRLKGLVKMVRRIGKELYWPLAQLDILNEYESPRRGKSFVCSQTTAIFDNLANQTFTVVNSLKLSQYNDFVRAETIKSNDPPIGNNNNYNLYACIVDADVRHNYATLGVHFREAPSKKISSEISKRLQARSAFKKPTKPDPQLKRTILTTDHKGVSSIAVETEKHTNFDLYRESQLQFPLKSSYWIPIQNSSSYRIDNPISGYEYPLNPTMLSTVILFVFTSLLALMYLTLRTYRNLTQNQLEEDLINQLEDNDDKQVVNEQRGDDILPDVEMDLIHTAGCLCQFVDNQSKHETSSISHHQTHMMFANEDPYTAKTEFVINDSLDQIYYQAHGLGDIEPQCVCHATNAPIIAVLPSEHLLADCCQSTLPITLIPCQQQNSRPRVNLIENPLVDGRK